MDWRKKPKRPKKFRHRIAVEVKPVEEFIASDMFSCPGCMRKLRGEWRYCDRCEAKKNGI